jgi:hypothetical protein
MAGFAAQNPVAAKLGTQQAAATTVDTTHGIFGSDLGITPRIVSDFRRISKGTSSMPGGISADS